VSDSTIQPNDPTMQTIRRAKTYRRRADGGFELLSASGRVLIVMKGSFSDFAGKSVGLCDRSRRQ